GRRLGDPVMINNVGAVIYPIWRERGRLGDLESATRHAVEESPTVMAYRAGLVQMLCELGNWDRAAEQLNTLAEDDFAAIPDDPLRPFNLCATAEAAAALGDLERAAQLETRLRPRAGKGAVIGAIAYHGAVDRYLGLLAMALGRHDQAVADLENALAIHEHMRARPWSARTRYDLA